MTCVNFRSFNGQYWAAPLAIAWQKAGFEDTGPVTKDLAPFPQITPSSVISSAQSAYSHSLRFAERL